MICPSCTSQMNAQTLDGHLGTSVQIDLCQTCQLFWFDHLESLRLAPAATLKLFQLIGEGKRASPRPVAAQLKCPRCDLRLLLTNDRQRNTPFRYWRCARDHGRLITWFDFLREKDFIRPLSAEQLDALRQNVQIVNCSNCGAPVDLVKTSACSHCGTPLSMLDLKQISAMAAQLSRAAEPPKGIDVDTLFEAIRAEHARDKQSSSGLVEAGLRLISARLA
jgi:hypothetical protein